LSTASVEHTAASLRTFEKAGLLRRYDLSEAPNGLNGALGNSPTVVQWREALVWAYRVWLNASGKWGSRWLEKGPEALSLFAGFDPRAES